MTRTTQQQDRINAAIAAFKAATTLAAYWPAYAELEACAKFEGNNGRVDGENELIATLNQINAVIGARVTAAADASNPFSRENYYRNASKKVA